MLLTDIRKRIENITRRMGDGFGPEEIDHALQWALNDLDLVSYHSLVLTGAVTMTAYDPEVDVSSLAIGDEGGDTSLTDFRPERVKRCMIKLTDQGTWATSTSYAVDDIVVGDGSPDSYIWKCVEAHTSSAANEPGAADQTVWERRLWKRGDNIEIADFKSIAHLLGDRPIFRLYLPDDYVFDTDPSGDNAGTPRVGAFMNQSLFYVYPPPDRAVKLEFLVEGGVTDWEPGTDAMVDIDVPKTVLHGVMMWGVPIFLQPTDPDTMMRSQKWDQHKRIVDGRMDPQDASDLYKDDRAFLDWRYDDPFTGRLLQRGG